METISLSNCTITFDASLENYSVQQFEYFQHQLCLMADPIVRLAKIDQCSWQYAYIEYSLANLSFCIGNIGEIGRVISIVIIQSCRIFHVESLCF